MTNDQFTEWLTNRFLFYRRRKNDLLLSEKERIQAEAKETECADCIYQYRSLAPTWIPVTPETMPDTTAEVLIYTNTGAVKEAWYMDGVWYGVEPYHLPITHWQKKPAPPINKQQ